MITAWTDHIKNEEQKVQYVESLRRGKWLLDDLSKILDKIEASLDRQELNTNVYDSPNWAFRQADANGYRRALRKIKQLISLDQKETNERKPPDPRGTIG